MTNPKSEREALIATCVVAESGEFRSEITASACALRGQETKVVRPHSAEITQACIELGIHLVDGPFLALRVQVHQLCGHIHNDLEPAHQQRHNNSVNPLNAQIWHAICDRMACPV